MVTPYYSKPPQSGLLEHFRRVADATEVPIMLYDIPGRSGVAIATDTFLRLAEHPRIVAVKDAKGDLAASADVMSRTDLAYYSGDDAMTLPLLSIGAVGVVGTSTHFSGLGTKQLIEAFVAGDVSTALRLHRQLLPIYTGIFATQGCILVKAGLGLRVAASAASARRWWSRPKPRSRPSVTHSPPPVCCRAYPSDSVIRTAASFDGSVPWSARACRNDARRCPLSGVREDTIVHSQLTGLVQRFARLASENSAGIQQVLLRAEFCKEVVPVVLTHVPAVTAEQPVATTRLPSKVEPEPAPSSGRLRPGRRSSAITAPGSTGWRTASPGIRTTPRI